MATDEETSPKEMAAKVRRSAARLGVGDFKTKKRRKVRPKIREKTETARMPRQTNRAG
jgi:hypothetical protein